MHGSPPEAARTGAGDGDGPYGAVAGAWFAGVFEQSAIGVAVIDRDGLAVACNDALGRLLGRDPAEVVGRRFCEFTDRRDRGRCNAVVRRVLDGDVDRFQVTKRFVRPDGSTVWGRLTATALRDDRGSVTHMIGVVEDVTIRRRTEGELAHRARHDTLTGLPNRPHLLASLEAALGRADESGGGVGVMVVDVDRFDGVNDSLGHAAGDALLRQVGSRVAEAIGEDDVLARSIGDAFVVVREGLTCTGELALLADRVRAALVEPYALPGGRRVHLSATFGVTAGAPPHATADSLLRDADIAVHEGKARAPGSIQWFDDELRRRVLDEADLLADLHDAIDRGELHLVYQPVVRLADRALVAAEALLRWEHPSLGPVPPRRFLPGIEGSELLSRITWWVLRTAASQAATWRRHTGFPLTVSVNVPAQVLLEADLVATLQHVLARARLPASALVLELTEHGLVDDGASSRLNLDRLRELGVNLYIDDFGTGWSSLSYLKRLPVHGLKIDRSFVRGLPDDPGDTSIVTAIAAMAQGVGLGVVAEGVETPAQLAALERMGVDYAQGFLLGRPVPPGDAALRAWGAPVRLDRGRADGVPQRQVAHQH